MKSSVPDEGEHLRTAVWWAWEDSNLQPDRYERSALTIELQALRGFEETPQTIATRSTRQIPCPARPGGRPRRSRPGQSFSSRFALPLRIFALSSSHSGTVFIHSTPGGLTTNGQSMANRIRSTPISCTQHISAGLEKLPLVVIQKLLQNTSRKLIFRVAP